MITAQLTVDTSINVQPAHTGTGVMLTVSDYTICLSPDAAIALCDAIRKVGETIEVSV